MNTTVRGTDDQGQRHVSQNTTSSTAKHDVCPVITPNQRITYTTAQLHENNNKCEVALSDGSDFVAEEMEFGQGWNSPSHTLCNMLKLKTVKNLL